MKETKKYIYEIIMLSVCHPSTFWTNWLVFMKFGMNIILLEITPTSDF